MDCGFVRLRTMGGKPWHRERCRRLLLRPSSMPRALENLPCKLIPLPLKGSVGGVGTVRGIKLKQQKTKTPFYNRTYNVLEATSTNTTSSSVWSLTNSWMQYITLTLPCIYPGQQGPERGTRWVGSGQDQGLRSPNLTVVCKKGSGCGDCALSAFQMTQIVKWPEKTLQVVGNDHLTL